MATEKTGGDFLDFVYRRGGITEEQYNAINQLRKFREYFGHVALIEEYVRLEQLLDALKEQRRLNYTERIGSIMKRKKYMTDEQVQDVLRKQREKEINIGLLMLEMNFINEDRLLEEVKAFETAIKK